jgi:prolyl-tRNA editing enzyme YbaK/EbsC (Cys-tRNA(Pro) deacylase)
MNTYESRGAEHATHLLASKRIPYQLVTLTASAQTAEDVLKFSSGALERWEICKTLLLRVGHGLPPRYVAVLLAATHRLDLKSVAKRLGASAHFATPDELERDLGLSVAGVCPLTTSLPLLIDRHVLELANINIGSGDARVGITLIPSDLRRCITYMSGNFSSLSARL